MWTKLQPIRLLTCGMLLTGFALAAQDVAPVLKLKLDEGKGNTVKNEVAGERPGRLDGKYQWVSGKEKSAVKFQPNSYIEVPAGAKLRKTMENGCFTLEAWLYREKDGDCGYVARQQDGFCFLVIPWDPTRLDLAIWDKSGKYIVLDTESGVLRTGVWQHVAAVVDRKTMKIYVDGKLQGQVNVEQGIKNSGENIYFGMGFDGPTKDAIHPLKGMLDNIAIYDYVKPQKYFEDIRGATTENFDSTIAQIGIPPRLTPGKKIESSVEPTIKVVPKKSVIVENGYYKLQLDISRFLKIKSLYSKYVDAECISSAGSALFNVAANRKSVLAEDFKVTKVTTGRSGNDHTVDFELESTANQLAASVRLTVNASRDINVDFKLRNNGSAARYLQVSAPILEAVSVGKDFQENYYFWPVLSGWVGTESYDLGMEYGKRCWLQVMDVFSPKLGGGVALWVKDSTGTVKGEVIRKTNTEGKVDVSYTAPLFHPRETLVVPFREWKGSGMAFVYLPGDLAPGKEKVYPTGVISVHGGSCLDPIKEYGHWARSWFKHRPMVPALKDTFNVLCLHAKAGNKGFEKGFAPNNQLKPEMFINPDGRDHLLQFACWWKNPHFGDNCGWGDYEYNPDWGGASGMRAALDKCRERGSRTCFYLCGRAVGKNTRIAKEKGSEWGYFLAPGKPADDWNECNMCTHDNGWQDYLAAVYGRVMKDIHPDGMYLDTSAEVLYCANNRHEHAANLIDDQVRFFTKIRKAIDEVDPNTYLWFEFLGSDFFAQYTDATWVQTFANPYAHSFNNFDLCFTRFVYPEIKHTEWGMGEKTFNVDSRRAFFNGIGVARGDITEEQNEHLSLLTQVLRENSEAFATMTPEALVATPAEKVYVNSFSIPEKQVWTIYNKNTNELAETVLDVSAATGSHYVEVLYDNPAEVTTHNLNDLVKARIPAMEVGCLVRFPCKLAVAQENGIVVVQVKDAPKTAKVLWTVGEDRNMNLETASFENGKATLGKTADIKGKLIVKLVNGNELLDEVVVNN